MKKILFLLLVTSNLNAQELKCPASKGIKNCKKDAIAFCDGEKFTMDSNSTEYSITCNKDIEEKVKKEDKSVSQKDDEKEKVEDKAESRIAFHVSRIGIGTYEGDMKQTNKSNGSNTTGAQTFELDRTFGLGLELRYMRKHGWGMVLGLDYDLEREIETKTLTQSGNSFVLSPTSKKAKLTTYSGFGTILYRLEKFYLGLGINLSVVDVSGLESDQVSSSIGAQMLLGYELGRSFAIDIIVRSLTYDLKFESAGFTYDFSNGGHSDTQLSLKYIF